MLMMMSVMMCELDLIYNFCRDCLQVTIWSKERKMTKTEIQKEWQDFKFFKFILFISISLSGLTFVIQSENQRLASKAQI